MALADLGIAGMEAAAFVETGDQAMRIGVTGGNGLIGRAVVDLAVADGHEVVSIDTAPPERQASGATFVAADVTRYDLLEQAVRGCDALVHLAAIRSPIGRPDYEVHNTNVVASYNALSVAARLGIQRVCQASSVNATGAAFSRQREFLSRSGAPPRVTSRRPGRA